MVFENTQLESFEVDQEVLTKVLEKFGLECHGGWDYDRMTFDRKFDIREGRYYLRLFCTAISGDVGANTAVLSLHKPVLGKYYYPHGVEYTDEVFPTHLVEDCEKVLNSVYNELQLYFV